MSSKHTGGKRQNMSLEDAKQKYNLGEIFDEIDSLESREIGPAEAIRLGEDLKKTIVNYNKRIEVYEQITAYVDKLRDSYKKLTDNRIEVADYWKGMTSHQQDLIDSQEKLIAVLEERDKYITENFNVPDVFKVDYDADGGEGDEEE